VGGLVGQCAAFDAYIRAGDDSLLIDDDIVATFCARRFRRSRFRTRQRRIQDGGGNVTGHGRRAVCCLPRPSIRHTPGAESAPPSIVTVAAVSPVIQRDKSLQDPRGQLTLTASQSSRPQLSSTPK